MGWLWQVLEGGLGWCGFVSKPAVLWAPSHRSLSRVVLSNIMANLHGASTVSSSAGLLFMRSLICSSQKPGKELLSVFYRQGNGGREC